MKLIYRYARFIFALFLCIQTNFFIGKTAVAVDSTNLSDQDISIIMNEYAKLPAASQPHDMSDALKLMNKGQAVINAIELNNFSEIICNTDLSDQLKLQLEQLFYHEIDPIELHNTLPYQLFTQLREAYLMIILYLQWGLYKHALLDHSGFDFGSITIIDRDEKFMNFLENYVRLVNRNYQKSGVAFMSVTNNWGYNRTGLSSHWQGGQIEGFDDNTIKSKRIYGINVKFKKKYANSLPTNKNHLHFAKLTHHRTFIKWEEFGTNISFTDPSGLHHAYNYVVTEERLMRHIEQPTFRVEHQIPHDILNFFYNFIPKKKITEKQKNIIKYQGISGMRKIVELQSHDDRMKFDNFLITIKNYNRNTLSYRKGNEVILDENNIITS